MAETKITAIETYEMIKGVMEAIEGFEHADHCIEFCEKEIGKIVRKNEKAKERAAEKRAAGDELQAKILEVLTDEFQTRDEICEKLANVEEITPNKVSNRMKNLIEAGQAEKDMIKIEGDTKKKTAYRLAQ